MERNLGAVIAMRAPCIANRELHPGSIRCGPVVTLEDKLTVSGARPPLTPYWGPRHFTTGWHFVKKRSGIEDYNLKSTLDLVNSPRRMSVTGSSIAYSCTLTTYSTRQTRGARLGIGYPPFCVFSCKDPTPQATSQESGWKQGLSRLLARQDPLSLASHGRQRGR